VASEADIVKSRELTFAAEKVAESQFDKAEDKVQ
jgi:hypothetical protein